MISSPAKTCNDDIVRELVKRYNGDSTDCTSEKGTLLPLYLCFGMMMHVADEDNFPYPWTLYDKTFRTSVAMSFLHKYSPFPKLYGSRVSGLILFPPSKTPNDRDNFSAYCAFPVDANTNFRTQNRGCTSSTSTIYPDARTKSQYCGGLGITDIQKWMTRTPVAVGADMAYIGASQCAFDMTGPNAAAEFKLALDLQNYIGNIVGQDMNEIVISPWDEQNLNKAPIEAFFYIIGSRQGLQEARTYRSEFLKKTQIEVPVVGIRLPTSSSGLFIEIDC